MEDNQPFFVGKQPFLFKIKGGPKPPDLEVTNKDLNRLAEIYTRGPDNTQEATWRRYRHYEELSDIMVCWMFLTTDQEVLSLGLLQLQDALLPKIRLFYQPPYGMYSVNGSLKSWKSLCDKAKNWKKKVGHGSLTQLRNAAIAEEEIDGQPYVSDGSQDNAPGKGGRVEDPIIISDNSDSESEGRSPLRPRGPPRERRSFGKSDPSTRRAAFLNGNNPNKKLVQRGQLIREKEQKLMSKPKQLMNPSVRVVSTSLISHDSIISKCGNCARRRRECYVEDARIRKTGRKRKLRCILCTVGNRVCII